MLLFLLVVSRAIVEALRKPRTGLKHVVMLDYDETARSKHSENPERD